MQERERDEEMKKLMAERQTAEAEEKRREEERYVVLCGGVFGCMCVWGELFVLSRFVCVNSCSSCARKVHTTAGYTQKPHPK